MGIRGVTAHGYGVSPRCDQNVLGLDPGDVLHSLVQYTQKRKESLSCVVHELYLSKKNNKSNKNSVKRYWIFAVKEMLS